MPGDIADYTPTTDGAANPDTCDQFDFWVCEQPIVGSPTYSLDNPGCDPEAGVCSVTATISVEFSGNRLNNTANCGFACSPVKTFVTDLADVQLEECGNGFIPILKDFGIAEVTGSAYCETPLAGKVKFKASSCTINPQPCGGPFTETRILDFAAGVGCPVQPLLFGANDPGSCSMTTSSGANLSSGGAGFSQSVAANFYYTAGGPGKPGTPGAADWLAKLGYYWSHDYAERIVADPDPSHVWLITKWGSFREFSNPDAGGLYQKVLPSDEFRELTWTGTEWTLAELNGDVHYFSGVDGRWSKTVLRPGVGAAPAVEALNTIAATYGPTDLTVDFPDGRQEVFGYDAGGRLESLTEHGIDGSFRVWQFGYSGDLLTSITRPDNTSWHYSYSGQPELTGYMTLREFRDSNGATPGRYDQGWDYDSLGNVIRTWRGDSSFGGVNATEKWQIDHDDPSAPVLVDVTDPLGEVTSYTFDRTHGGGRPRLSSVTGGCPLCGLANSAYTYMADSLQPDTVIDANGNETEFQYNFYGRLIRRERDSSDVPTPGLHQVTEWEYNSPWPALVTKLLGPSVEDTPHTRITTTFYDAFGNLDSRVSTGDESTYEGPPTGSFDLTTDFALYNDVGRVGSIDPPGFGTADQTTFAYSDPAWGPFLVSATTAPDPNVTGGAITSYTYDGYGRRLTVTDPNSVTTQTLYDDLDRLTSVTQGFGSGQELTTSYEYNDFGDLERVTLPLGNRIEYEYDGLGRLRFLSRVDDVGQARERTEYAYDAAGNRELEMLQRHNGASWDTLSTTRSTYSSACELASVTRGDGVAGEESTTTFRYDCNGNLQFMWDANHVPPNPASPDPSLATEYTYDGLDRLIRVDEPWGPGGADSETHYAYDIQDHLTSVTDAEGNVTTYEYSDRDLLVAEDSEGASGLTTHRYNEHGALVESQDARGVVVLRVVDELGRVELVDFPTDPDIDYTYGSDPAFFEVGRLLSIQRGSTFVGYEYDQFGRVLVDGDLGYGYDDNGNRTSITYPGGVMASYSYDFADRPEGLSVDPGTGNTTSIASGASYLPSGPLDALTIDLGTLGTELRGYTAAYFPNTILVPEVGPALLDWQYTTDAVGNVQAIDDMNPGTDADRSFGYQDFQYYLTCAAGPWSTSPAASCEPPSANPVVWSYDRIGNRTSEARDGFAPDVYSYSQNAATPSPGNTSLLSSVALGIGGSRSYSYTDAGHVDSVDASGNVVQLSWDEEGRLSRLDRVDEYLPISYDGRSFFRRAGDTGGLFVDGFETGDTSCWGVGGSGCVAAPQTRLTTTYDSSGRLHVFKREGGNPVEWVVFYFGGRPIARLKVPDQAGGSPVEPAPADWHYLATDHLGTPQAVQDEAGALVWSGGFEPFGEDSAQTATGADLFLRLPGQWEDPAIAQVSSGAGLYYNVHRWYEFGTGRYSRVDPLLRRTVAPYSYADGRPSRFIDPLGLEKIPCSDCESVERAQANAKHRINLLKTTGTAVDTTPGGVNEIAAETWCGGSGTWGDPTTFRPPNGSKFYEEPCKFLCTGVHERVHRRGCATLGFDAYAALTEVERELPAYEEELKCLEQAAARGFLDLTMSGVAYPGAGL